MFIMNTLPLAKRAQILGLLVEGTSINATCRITGAAKADRVEAARGRWRCEGVGRSRRA